MADVLHDDEPDRTVEVGDKVVRNLTAEEYEKTYDEPGTTGGHEVSEEFRTWPQ